MASHGIPRYQQEGELSDQARAKQSRQIEEYKALVQQVTDTIAHGVLTHDTLDLTSRLLTLNPEYYTIWNYRRHVIQHLLADVQLRDHGNSEKELREVLVNDMHFLLPLLIKYPKCYWIWNHRRWLLLQCSAHLNSNDAKAIWTEELGLVGKMLTRDSRNFHGWGYRRFVVGELQKFVAKSVQSMPATNSERLPRMPLKDDQCSEVDLTEVEFDYTTRMIKMNLSNFSAWHYRSKLIPKMLDKRNSDFDARRRIFDDELSLIRSAIFTDPYDQSLWFYHEFLIIELCSKDQGSFATFTDQERYDYLEREVSEIRDLLEDTTDCKLIYQHLIQYSSLYSSLGGGVKTVSMAELRSWLKELMRLDPLRRGRWEDKSIRLDLE